MEELAIEDVLAGLNSAAYVEHHTTLLQHLSNLVCESLPKPLFTNVVSTLMKILEACQSLPSQQEKIETISICFSNMTVLESSSDEFLALIEDNERASFDRLVDKFFRIAVDKEPSAAEEDETTWMNADPYRHISSLLCNLTRQKSGQQLLLRKSSRRMELLLQQLRSRSLIRRVGLANCLRNCLFDSGNHFWLLHELNVLDYVIPPLIVAGPFTEKEKTGMNPTFIQLAESPEKSIDPCKDVVLSLLYCIVLLCQTRVIRQELRKQRIYCIVRNLDSHMDDEVVSEITFEIVNFLERDDCPYELEDNIEAEKERLLQQDSKKEIAETAVSSADPPVEEIEAVETHRRPQEEESIREQTVSTHSTDVMDEVD